MNNGLFIDAVGYLDEDILAKHLTKKEKLRKKAVNKKKYNIMRWSTVAACICILVAVSIMVIPYVTEPSENNTNIINNDFFESLDNSDTTSILSYYPYTEYSSFVKMKINKIYDGLYSSDNKQIKKFVLAEGVVIEDYYENIAKGTTVTIPIIINYMTISNDESQMVQYYENDVTNLLTKFSSFYVYLRSGMTVRKDVYSINDGATQSINSLSSDCAISSYSIIPINEEKVCLNSLDAFMENNQVSYLRHEKIAGFDKVIFDGQKETELDDNIRKLYEYFTKESLYEKD